MYDRVNHHMPFDGLEMIGINKRSLELLKDAASDNKVKLMVGDLNSEWIRKYPLLLLVFSVSMLACMIS